jgi:Predicted metal binding domain
MVDSGVSRLKFEREVQTLSKQRQTMESRGIFLLDSTAYPFVELGFVPRHPVQVGVPAAQSGSVVLPPGAMMAVEIPSIAARAFKARFDLTGYDLQAPSVEFRDFWTDNRLEYATMFRALEYEKERKAHVVLLDDHPITHKPFLCIRGIREYHEHPQHSGDDWLLYRHQMNLFSIVMSLWRVTIDLVHPQIFYQPNGLQVNWGAEEKI